MKLVRIVDSDGSHAGKHDLRLSCSCDDRWRNLDLSQLCTCVVHEPQRSAWFYGHDYRYLQSDGGNGCRNDHQRHS